MDQNTRCENCGRKLPCEPCAARARQALSDALLDHLDEMLADAPQPLLIWFDLPEDAAWQHLNRLAAEWPGALDIIFPTEEGDLVGCTVAFHPDDLKRSPQSEWEVSETRVRCVDDETQDSLEAMFREARREWWPSV